MGGVDRTKTWDRVVMHVDMDAFFAEIETRNCPQLRGKPVIVGGDPRYRSVVSTCNYEARKYGVHSAMPITEAKRLCPNGVYVSGSLRMYVYTSALLQKIFERYSPIVEPVSVDEAFLDLTGCHKIFGTVENLVEKMKHDIREELQLTCSVGIAPTRLIAKMGSGENKPDGMTILDREDFKKLFYPRPVDALWGVGESTKKSLAKIGIYTVADLAAKKAKELIAYFGKNGEWLSSLSRGLGSSKIYSIADRPDDKSMSHETTLVTDLSDIERIYSTILWLSDKVARRMRRYNYVGKTVSVKIRSSKFETITRDKTLNKPTDQRKIIYETAKKLIPREYGPRVKVRLLGVRMSHLEEKEENNQLELLDDFQKSKLENTTRAVDSIRDKFGDSIIKLAGTSL